MSYRAVVIGATGAVGSALVRELLASSACVGVVALIRRPADGLPPSSKLAVHAVQFDALQERTAKLAAGCEVAFCTIGVGQPRKVAFDEFWKVDVEYAGVFARGAAAAGVRHISLLSSVGANLSSRNSYLRVKGVAEQIVERAGIGIARTSHFRPSLLVTRQLRYGLQDRLTQRLFPLVAPLLPNRYHQIRVEDLARAMRLNAERTGPQGVEVLEYPDFMHLMRDS